MKGFKPNHFLAIPLILMILNSGAYSQEKFTLSGIITDEETGEALIGANIYVTTLEKGTSTNTYGFYSLTLPRTDSLGIIFSYIGYIPQIKKIYADKNLELEIEMKPSTSTLEEVTIQGQQDANVARPQMSVVNIPLEKIKELPVILGEIDVLKVIQLLPGVQSGNEGTTGIFVRGGNADQNLVLLDEATVYNPSHLFGLFSTFNSRALNNVTLIKGGFPAQYGGRLSSILDISMKEGNNRKFQGEGGIGLVTSQLTLEGPIKKEKASFIVSGRRTYIDLILTPFLEVGNSSDYHFYDINGKVNWKISSKDRLFFSFFTGKDDALYNETKGISYNIKFGNSAATLRWNHLFGQKLFLNTSLIYNTYEQDIATIQDNFFSQVVSGINDVNGKMEFQYFPSLNHEIRFGAHYTNHRFLSGGKSEAQTSGNQTINVSNLPSKYFSEYAFYVNDEFNIYRGFSANLGFRFPGFSDSDVNYFEWEPRATLKLQLGPTSSVKAAYTVMHQFLHLVPSSTASVPTDIWLPSSKRTKPQLSEQFAIGYFRNFNQNQFETSAELYYKTMDNQVLFREGNQLIESLEVDTGLVYGKGESYGLEFFLRKNTGPLTGWLSYTLSKTDQKFDSLNFGRTFPFQYDRRHAVSLAIAYKINPRWTVSAVFEYATGKVKTLPVGRINSYYGGSLYEGTFYVYEERNNARLKDYHRLDISAIYKRNRKIFRKEYVAELVFGVYNIYSRQNPYFVYFLVDPVTDQPRAKQVSLLPILPSLSYNFKF
jgi:hypothetical protein